MNIAAQSRIDNSRRPAPFGKIEYYNRFASLQHNRQPTYWPENPGKVPKTEVIVVSKELVEEHVEGKEGKQSKVKIEYKNSRRGRYLCGRQLKMSRYKKKKKKGKKTIRKIFAR